MDYRKATYQQLAIILWDDPTATWREQAEARAEMWRRVRPMYQRVQYKIRRG